MARPKDTRRGSQKRYQHPIPSREDITATMESIGRPLTLVSLAGQLGLKGEARCNALENRLKAMVRDGQLLRNRAKEYCLTHHLDLVKLSVSLIRLTKALTNAGKDPNWVHGAIIDSDLDSTYIAIFGIYQLFPGRTLWSIKPELTSSYARQSVVFPPSGDGGYLSIQP